MIEVNDLQALRRTIDVHPRVVVDFSAESWCVPCQRLAPHFAKFAEQRDDLVCVKVDVDADPLIASSFNIQSVPQVVLFSGGRYVKHLTGRTVLQLDKEV